jgi:putative PIG3 family NAD(P)H quinone oxidoreductase
MATMTAIEVSAPGGPEVLRLAQRPRPAPRAGEVLVRVAAAGVNYPDVLQRQGRYPPPPGASDVPGLEIAGTVEECGAEAGDWRPGDAVCALVAGGGYAEYCLAPVPQCLPLPRGLGFTAAAALPETTFTVWTNVFERGHLAPGEVLLVHGGSGGIGTTAISLGRAFGARVLATAGGAEKGAACVRLGAERAIDHTREDFVAVVREVTGGRGADVILDILGGDALPRNLSCLAVEGRLLQIALLRGGRGEIDLMAVMQKRLTLTGSTLRSRSVEEKGAIARQVRAKVWPLIESGDVRPLVHAVLSLAEAAEAHRLMESRRHVGKIVLRVGDPQAS